ncbi:MAG: hypothetical protein JXB48_11895 [Candidatus Latescibacteria bacterium]|nr:hypothetical protein [Candidatus Latescibacterota bacterium]
MKTKNTFRIPIGFAAGILYLFRADPTIWSFFAGASLMLAGEAIRFISAGTLIKFEGVTRTGIYAYSRNPLYLGSFIIGAGACLIGRDIPFALFYVIAFPLIYIRIIKREEQHLTERYGEDYEHYIREVPLFWSGRFSIRKILGASSPFLAVKNRELKTVLGIVAILAVMASKIIF